MHVNLEKLIRNLLRVCYQVARNVLQVVNCMADSFMPGGIVGGLTLELQTLQKQHLVFYGKWCCFESLWYLCYEE